MPTIFPIQDFGSYENAIKSLIGSGIPWHVQWAPFNWVKIKTSLPWVYSNIINNEKAKADDYGGDSKRYPIPSPLYTDNDHILIFPQDANNICPRAWIEAAWPFIAKFRSAFTMYPEQAGLYTNITLIGHPDVEPHIDAEYVEAITNSDWRSVERIFCRSGEQLREILQARINDGRFFRGKNEG